MSKNKEEQIEKEEVEVATVWQEEFDAKAKECEEMRDKYMRCAAEYDNFRKRTVRERETLYSDATNTTIGAFLEVYDNLERALENRGEDEALTKGLEMIYNGFCETLNKFNVEVVNPQGEKFDPNLHNAVMHVEDETVDESTVVEVFQKGFKRGDRVIRFAIVKVAN